MSYQAAAIWVQMANFMAQEKYQGNIEGFSRRARSLRKGNLAIQAAQRRRAFVSAARETIAQTEVERLASAGEGALDSSALQGQRASYETQLQTVLDETRQIRQANVRIERLEDRARRHAQDAGKIDKAANSISSGLMGMS